MLTHGGSSTFAAFFAGFVLRFAGFPAAFRI
jgi:hypothetical protein